jgi:hypothetical protein
MPASEKNRRQGVCSVDQAVSQLEHDFPQDVISAGELAVACAIARQAKPGTSHRKVLLTLAAAVCNDSEHDVTMKPVVSDCDSLIIESLEGLGLTEEQYKDCFRD